MTAKSIILATGSERRTLGVPGEVEYNGCGVSYCATCDGFFFQNRIVCVVGGSDSAAKEALVLSRLAKKVYVIYRRSRLRAEPVMAEIVYSCGNIEVIHNANITEICGNDDGEVAKVILDTGAEIETDGVFIEVGFNPRSSLAEVLGIACNDAKEIIVDKSGRTSMTGVFAAGDVTDSILKQAITAAGDGATACWSAFQYIQAGRDDSACSLNEPGVNQ